MDRLNPGLNDETEVLAGEMAAARQPLGLNLDFLRSVVDAVGPREAEAGVIGKVIRTTAKTLAKTSGESSASAKLKGFQAFGKVIDKVLKGQGNWRYLIFEDGTQLAVEKDVVTSLAREAGTKAKMAELAAKEEGEPRLAQALKSLDYHMRRQSPFATRSLKDAWHKKHKEDMRKLGIEPEEYVWVKSHKIYMPKSYATILEDAGYVKIGK